MFYISLLKSCSFNIKSFPLLSLFRIFWLQPSSRSAFFVNSLKVYAAFFLGFRTIFRISGLLHCYKLLFTNYLFCQGKVVIPFCACLISNVRLFRIIGDITISLLPVIPAGHIKARAINNPCNPM